MKYIVAYIDSKSGRYLFTPFDYYNDAKEFRDIKLKSGWSAHLYIQEDET